MIKVKHARTADCVVAGFRWHKTGKDTARRLAAARAVRRQGRAAARRRDLVVHDGDARAAGAELAPLRERALEQHPWREWAEAGGEMETAHARGQSRWSAGKDLSWEPLRIERVCEVKYDHMQGDRFRHAAIFQRWRPDKQPGDCRYDQLEVTTPYELEKVFGAARAAAGDVPHSSALVRIERFLRGPQLFGNVLQIDADARPRVKPAAHGVHEHVGGLQMRGGLGMARFQRSSPASASAFRCARPISTSGLARLSVRRDGCTRARLAGLLPVVRRPRRIAQPSRSCVADSSSSGSSEQACRSIAACRSPSCGERATASWPA